MYRVNKPFQDRLDDMRGYRSDDWYPRFNFEPTNERIESLIEKGFIEAIEETPAKQYPHHTGGGWYELSNGEKVQGKEEAEKLEVGD